MYELYCIFSFKAVIVRHLTGKPNLQRSVSNVNSWEVEIYQLKGVKYTLNLKLACFVCYLKVSTLCGKIMYICILKQIVQGTQNDMEILVGQAVFKLWIKTVKILFCSITAWLT